MTSSGTSQSPTEPPSSGSTNASTHHASTADVSTTDVSSAQARSQTPNHQLHGHVEVFVADEQDDVALDADRWLRLAVQVLAAQGVTGRGTPDVEMSLYFVDEDAIAALNQQYMGKEGPTDVLSFPIDGEDAVSPSGRMPDNGPSGPNDDGVIDDEQPLLLGDVLICPAVAARNAAEHMGTYHDGSIDDELALLVVHGILHLLGMDHMVEAEALVMEARERVLLHQFHRPILSDAEVQLHDEESHSNAGESTAASTGASS
jgi:probable rRNA maturation factor